MECNDVVFEIVVFLTVVYKDDIFKLRVHFLNVELGRVAVPITVDAPSPPAARRPIPLRMVRRVAILFYTYSLTVNIFSLIT
ncbi:hypothetical protein [Haladaptatus halobius]|uniref:hypothetical protein n=1 Tax=Haladaptatus halobius TaxID=2884875 RepID=UPI001D0B1584|nr:hypothetical protein [Haladaptatus halobius]